MASKHPHQERVTDDYIEGAGEKLGEADLGKGAKVYPPKKKSRAAEREPSPDPESIKAGMFLNGLETDLHARDERGNKIPTLAERIAAEGFQAQLNPSKRAKKK